MSVRAGASARAVLAFAFLLVPLLGASAQEIPGPGESEATPPPSASALPGAGPPQSTPQSAPPPAPPRPAKGRCPRDMVYVEGASCPALTQACLEWLPPLRGSPPRCARFEPFAGAPSCPTPAATAHPLRFCIDRFEYPNRDGALPVIQRTWEEAQATCRKRGRRLCKSAEWTLACEGEERLAYPYGDVRDPEACNIDQPLELPPVRRHARHRVRTRPTPKDHRVRSGAFGRCVSPYGVHDMTGNVDEWVANESGWPHASGLKGGFWGPVRASCRPMTTAHDVTFAYYQIGFRCCDEPRS